MKNIFIISIAIIIASCGNNKPTTQQVDTVQLGNQVSLTPEQMKNAGIVLGTFTDKPMSTSIKVFGVIDVPPQNMISVSLPLGGYLQETQLLPGMHVNKGEVIATVEDQQFIQLQQDYLSAKTKLQLLDKEYNRQKEMNRNKASSDKSLQQSEADYNTQKIMVKAISEKLKLIHLNPDNLSEQNISRSIKIYSPISGFVKHVNVNIGKYVMPSEVLFELVNPEDIHLNLKIFEKDLNKLSIGQKVMAYTNEQPTVKYPCEIILISKDLKSDRSAEVHCHFEKYDKTLLPGMYMNAEIALHSGLSKVLPSDAIVSFENKQYAFIAISANEFKMVEVQIGNTENGFTEIESDVSSFNNSKMVLSGAYSLLMQLKNQEEK